MKPYAFNPSLSGLVKFAAIKAGVANRIKRRVQRNRVVKVFDLRPWVAVFEPEHLSRRNDG